MTNLPNETASSRPYLEARACPRCGLTETMLRTEGLLGCTTCYETFADLVVQAVAALHGVTVSLNNVPVDPAPETLPTVTPPARRKSLSWLPRRRKSDSSSTSTPSDAPTGGKKNRSTG